MSFDNIFVRPAREQRRVVVTGMGVVSPLGLNLKDTWAQLIEGRSGIDGITAFDASAMDTKIAGEVKGFDSDLYINKKDQKKMDRFIHLSLGSTQMALEDSGLKGHLSEYAERAGVIFGVGMGGLPYIEKQNEVLTTRGPSRISPFFIPAVISNLTAGQISILHGTKGPNFTTTSACASGAHAIGEAAKYIRDGLCDVMIAGGSEAVVCPMAIAGFSAMRALSTRNDQPQLASRPWDRDRDGFVLSEGSATLILEDFEHASRRGAKIYGELVGYGASADAYHMTSPSVGGEGAAMAMMLALRDAGLTPQHVGYINAHGTSTPVGDEIETQAIRRVFGSHADNLWVSSTKSMTGHTLGAAGALESVFSLMTLSTGIVPPTRNLEHPSPDCDLDFVPQTARERGLRCVLNNSFGFGGTNVCLAFAKI